MIQSLSAAECLQERWFVMHVSRIWKQAEQWLSEPEVDFQYFIPKIQTLRRSGGKTVATMTWAIPGYLFIRASQRRIVSFKQRHNRLCFVSWVEQGKPTRYLTVDDVQMADFIRVCSSAAEGLIYHAPGEINLAAGTRIKIIGGAFNGVTGRFVKVKGKLRRRLVVSLDDFWGVSAEVTPDLIEIL